MNEKKTTITIIILISLLFISTGFSTFCASNLRRANRKFGELTVRLSETESRLTAASSTISQCSESVGRISSAITDNTKELGTIIQNLIVIRNQVEYLEECLNDYNTNYITGDFIYSFE